MSKTYVVFILMLFCVLLFCFLILSYQLQDIKKTIEDILLELKNIPDILLELKNIPDTLDVKFPSGMSTTMDSTTGDYYNFFGVPKYKYSPGK